MTWFCPEWVRIGTRGGGEHGEPLDRLSAGNPGGWIAVTTTSGRRLSTSSAERRRHARRQHALMAGRLRDRNGHIDSGSPPVLVDPPFTSLRERTGWRDRGEPNLLEPRDKLLVRVGHLWEGAHVRTATNYQESGLPSNGCSAAQPWKTSRFLDATLGSDRRRRWEFVVRRT